jgi:uncharacterized membrane protein
MSSTKRKLAIAAVAAALSGTALVADARADCKVVKEDPNCWGDTCATKTVCTPGPAWTREQKKVDLPDVQTQTSNGWLKKSPTQPTNP